jgi:hypothetical protein
MADVRIRACRRRDTGGLLNMWRESLREWPPHSEMVFGRPFSGFFKKIVFRV